MPFDEALEARDFTSPLAPGRAGALGFAADAFAVVEAAGFADAFGADRGAAGRGDEKAGEPFNAA